MNNKIYLAGKISKYNWRNKILKDSRIDETNTPYILEEGFEYVGPYFLSCDHGCYHGYKTHGRRICSTSICSDDYKNETREKTISKCYEWIDNTDILFCWIDDITAYGTFTEIGYASAKKKIIYIACDKKIEKSSLDIWFPLLSSDVLTYEDNIEDAWENFVKWHNNGMVESFHKIYTPISESQFYFIQNLFGKSRYELLIDTKELRNISSETAGKIIAVLKNKNKTIEDYNLSNILKLKENFSEKEPFYYIEKPGVIKTQISNFLKNNVSFKNSDGSLMELYLVNKIDRLEVAKQFTKKIIYEKSYSFISGEKNIDLFIEDVAKRIDAIIPRQYYVEYTSLLYPEFHKTFITENFLGKNHYEFTRDLVYKYKENEQELIFEPELIDNRINIHKDYDKAKSILKRNLIKKEKKKLEQMSVEERFKYKRKIREKNNEKIPATPAQLDYLSSLVDKNGYYLKNKSELDMDSASDLIDIFKNKAEVSIKLASKFLEQSH